ncbi:hypothetical protein AWJ14_18420 [Hoeflea olei]|uniref:B12-binding domain-containing protein n=2 Tax=Hoeflea olei TaxID=1480615 RepID=A0A1C1YY32_9HYPH|nr:hypothetical protein AWJ14_18420 [Hoeflea olei]
MRGTAGGSRASPGGAQSASDDATLHHVIERAIVHTYFKAAAPEAESEPAAGDGGRPPPGAEAGAGRARRSGATGAVEVRRQGRSRSRTGPPGSPGASTLERMQRFISVLDKVYSKVLTDGDFDFVGFMRARSLGPSEMLDLLEACAARLGEEWGCDNLGFVRVVIASSRLQRILTTLSQENRCFEPFLCDRSMLLIVPRGETHLFAVSLMEERFRLRGWETRFVVADRTLDLTNLLKTSDFQLVCLTWLDSALKNQVEPVLHAIATSVNRERTCVIAGGPAAEEFSQWLAERGVENVCSDAANALETAERVGANRYSAHSAVGTNGSLLEPSQSA